MKPEEVRIICLSMNWSIYFSGFSVYKSLFCQSLAPSLVEDVYGRCRYQLAMQRILESTSRIKQATSFLTGSHLSHACFHQTISRPNGIAEEAFVIGIPGSNFLSAEPLDRSHQMLNESTLYKRQPSPFRPRIFPRFYCKPSIYHVYYYFLEQFTYLAWM